MVSSSSSSSASSSSSGTAAPPSVGELATAIHHAVAADPAARVVFVRRHRSSVALGFWDVPDIGVHPVEPLIGFLAPPSWDAIGLVTPGRLRSLAPTPMTGAGADAEPVLTTVLLERDGSIASVVGRSTGPLQQIHEPPIGLVPDVLARTVSRTTPAADVGPDAYLELVWLDRIATGLLRRPSRCRSWRWLADRHPLRSGGLPPPPEELRRRVVAWGEDHPWSALRTQLGETELPAAWCGPPDGTLPPAADWFDDGSLSRWMLRHLPPADALLPDLLAVLPSDLGRALGTALVDRGDAAGSDGSGWS